MKYTYEVYIYTYTEGRCVYIHSIGYNIYCEFGLEVYMYIVLNEK